MAYLGDFKQSVGVASLGVHALFTTVKACGVPVALVSGAARTVKNGLASGLHATGVTLTQSAGSITGLNKIVVLTSAALYTSGNYDIILSTGSVNGINSRGYLIGSFSIQSRSNPTATGVWAVTSRTLSSGSVVWSAATRTLTSGSAVASSVWASTTRVLTSGSVVWSAATRTLTSGGAVSDSVWAETVRTLTSGANAASSVWAYTGGAGRQLTSTGNTAAGTAVWASTTRILTSGAAIWAAAVKRLSATGINDVWDERVDGLEHTTTGMAGERLKTAAAGGGVSASGVWTYATRTLTSGGAAGTSVWAAASRTLTSGATIAPSVWKHATVTGGGRTLTTTGVSNIWSAATRTLTSGATVASSVWAAATRTLTSGGAASTSVWAATTRTLTSGSTVASSVWAAATRTLTSGGAPATSVWAAATRTLTSGGAASTSVWAAATRTMTSGGAVWDATLTELVAVPAAAPTPDSALMWMYQASRNKRITTATGDKVHTNATGVVGTAPVAFVTGTQTFTRSKYV